VAEKSSNRDGEGADWGLSDGLTERYNQDRPARFIGDFELPIDARTSSLDDRLVHQRSRTGKRLCACRFEVTRCGPIIIANDLGAIPDVQEKQRHSFLHVAKRRAASIKPVVRQIALISVNQCGTAFGSHRPSAKWGGVGDAPSLPPTRPETKVGTTTGTVISTSPQAAKALLQIASGGSPCPKKGGPVER
jgi:hypothetical protein